MPIHQLGKTPAAVIRKASGTKAPLTCPVARDQWGFQSRDRATIMMVGCCRRFATYSGNSLDTAIRAAETNDVLHTVEFLKVGIKEAPAALRRLPGFLVKALFRPGAIGPSVDGAFQGD